MSFAINCHQGLVTQCLHYPNFCSVGWGCRIYQLFLCRGVRLPPNEYPGYDTKQTDGEISVMLELWGMWSTPSLPLLPDPLWPRVIAPDRVLSMSQIELNSVIMFTFEQIPSGKVWTSHILPCMGWIILLLSFQKFGIK